MNNFKEKENNVLELKNNEASTKKAWQTPEIIDLNIDRTKGGSSAWEIEHTPEFHS